MWWVSIDVMWHFQNVQEGSEEALNISNLWGLNAKYSIYSDIYYSAEKKLSQHHWIIKMAATIFSNKLYQLISWQTEQVLCFSVNQCL